MQAWSFNIPPPLHYVRINDNLGRGSDGSTQHMAAEAEVWLVFFLKKLPIVEVALTWGLRRRQMTVGLLFPSPGKWQFRSEEKEAVDLYLQIFILVWEKRDSNRWLI